MPETPEIPEELPLTDEAAVMEEAASASDGTPETTSVPETTKEHAPMLDVHPAHHAASTWKDFFIHIATIVIGLLIAVGLEQTVEYFHHQHQRHDVRQGILADANLYLHDVDELRLVNRQRIEDLNTRIEQLQAALAHHQPLVSPTYRPPAPTNTIRLGNFSAAKASGLVQLLTEDEITTLSDAEVGVAKSEALKELAQEATRRRVAFEQRFQTSYPEGAFDFAAVTPAQLNEYLGFLIEERVRRAEYLAYLDEMHGGAILFLKGQRDIEKIRHAEEDSLSPSQH
jgi:hypothetical protein